MPQADAMKRASLPVVQRPAERARAVALRYATGELAPQVVAKGRGAIAEAIIGRALDSNVYVHRSPELVSLLMQVDLDEHIPPALYVAVAELLAWLYREEHAPPADAGRRRVENDAGEHAP
jgi:flagellar biosynthesis protein